jgi:hypothetical protein
MRTRALILTLLIAACDAGSSELSRRPEGTSPEEEAAAGQPLPEGTSIGKPQLRRLTKAEYEASVRDALGLGADWKSDLTADRSEESGFDNEVELLEVDESKNAELVAAAESVADLAKLSCAPSRACAEATLASTGAKLFRRALAAAEKAEYLQTFDEVAARTTPKDGMKWTLVSLLSSPHFLYRSELGKPASNGRHVLTGEEIATELAYTFSGTLPDEQLLEMGRRGELLSPEARVREATRLLSSQRVLLDFARQWLRYEDVKGIAKDEAVVPGFARVRDDMAEETRRFLEDLFFQTQGTVRDLFTARQAFVTPALATHYGIQGTERPEEQAIGILAHGSILSRYALTQASSPSQRGAFVQRKLFCRHLPPPPPNVGEPPTPQPGLTTREIYENIHSAQPSCAGCHKMIDPIGFGLEHFDTAGRYRTSERGKPVNAKASSGFGAWDDHRGMAKLLAESKEVGACVGEMMARYAFGSETGKELTLRATREELQTSKLPLSSFFARIAASPHFVVRQP